jgi:hypothetical protein
MKIKCLNMRIEKYWIIQWKLCLANRIIHVCLGLGIISRKQFKKKPAENLLAFSKFNIDLFNINIRLILATE